MLQYTNDAMKKVITIIPEIKKKIGKGLLI